MRPIPVGRSITLKVHDRELALAAKGEALATVPANAATRFTVVDRGLGRVALRAADGRFVAVRSADAPVGLLATEPAGAAAFQWIENVYGDLMLLSLSTNRYLCVAEGGATVTADHAGPAPDRHDGSCFDWSAVEP